MYVVSEGLIPFRDRLGYQCVLVCLVRVVCGSVGCEDTLGDYCQCTGASGSGSGLCLAWRLGTGRDGAMRDAQGG